MVEIVNEQHDAELFSQAIELFGIGHHEQASKICQKIIEIDSSHISAIHLLGIIACQVGKWNSGALLFIKAIHIDPLVSPSHFNLGTAHLALNRVDEAIRSCRNALVIDPDYCDAFATLGEAELRREKFLNAEKSYHHAIILNPWSNQLHNNLSIVFIKQEKLVHGLHYSLISIIIDPSLAESYFIIASSLSNDGIQNKAVDNYIRAIRIKPDHIDAMSDLAGLFNMTNRPNDAVIVNCRLVCLIPHVPSMYLNYGISLQASLRLDDAYQVYRKAIKLDPGLSPAHANLGYVLLTQGKFLEGWGEHEWRLQGKEAMEMDRHFQQPRWDGKAGSNKILLVIAEQGFGDNLQFCRYLPMIADRGWRLLLEVPSPLVRIMESIESVERVIAYGDDLPEFDAHCQMLSLPWIFRTTFDTIPAKVPYLYPDEALVKKWQKLVPSAHGRLKVGIVWAGNPRFGKIRLTAIDARRSISPELLAPLFECPNIDFFSLQKSDPVREALRPPFLKGGRGGLRSPNLINLMDQMNDFADTSALIANLDLVISVDTSVAHLAGAMGKPVWLLDRFDSCWRWLQGRDDSPWYPSLRIYRQDKLGDWGNVIDRVRKALGEINPLPLKKEGRGDLGDAIALHLSGRRAMQERDFAVGGILIGKAILSWPDNAVLYSDLGNVLLETGQFAKAVDVTRRAIQIDQSLAEAHFNHGVALEETDNSEQGGYSYLKAIILKPDNASFYYNYGIFIQNGRHEGMAIIFYHKTISIEPNHTDTYVNYGNCLKAIGCVDESVVFYQKAIDLYPAEDCDPPGQETLLTRAHTNLALALLAKGDFSRGWTEYEWRWRGGQMSDAIRAFKEPRWDGADGKGKKLLIYAEQGYGDSIQFCRYLPMVAARGWHLLFEVPAPLVRLIRSMDVADRVIAAGEKLPDFDSHCPLLSLPLIFGTDIDSIPAVIPYLHSERELVEQWRERILPNQNRLRIGIAWAGNPRLGNADLTAIDARRSIHPNLLTPLFECPNIDFFSLQKKDTDKKSPLPPFSKGGDSVSVSSPPFEKGGRGGFLASNLIDFMDEVHDFSDTAALIANLDLVISVDTAIVHLAGALGKPVWLLDRFDACWRWLRGRNDSPWYPSLRIFRQTKADDWSDVVAMVCLELKQLKQNPSSLGKRGRKDFSPCT